jgi:hypothetical protein
MKMNEETGTNIKQMLIAQLAAHALASLPHMQNIRDAALPELQPLKVVYSPEIQRKIQANVEKKRAANARHEHRAQVTQEIVREYGLNFLHIRERQFAPGDSLQEVPAAHGGMTIAYALARGNKKKDTIVQVATALCNIADCYNKREGRYIAAQNFKAGRVIQLDKVNPGRSTAAFLLFTFDYR